MSISTLDDLDDDLPDIFPGEVVHNENGDLGFKIINQIGAGRCCVVYKAVAVRDGSVVALKCFRHGSNYDGAIQRERFILESYLELQPNIVNCYSILEYRGFTFFVMELLQDNIRQIIYKNNRQGLSPWAVVKFAKDLIMSLDTLHKDGLVHADLKPHNILWSGQAKVFKTIDFGLSFSIEEQDLHQVQSIGYRSPEAEVWNSFKENQKFKRKRRLEGTFQYLNTNENKYSTETSEHVQNNFEIICDTKATVIKTYDITHEVTEKEQNLQHSDSHSSGVFSQENSERSQYSCKDDAHSLNAATSKLINNPSSYAIKENILCNEVEVSTSHNSINLFDEAADKFESDEVQDWRKSRGRSVVTDKHLHYNPPQKPGTASDIWSYGCLLAEVLTGHKLFQVGDKLASVLRPSQMLEMKLGDTEARWADRGQRDLFTYIKDLITRCLSENPSERIRADEAVNHPIFSYQLSLTPTDSDMSLLPTSSLQFRHLSQDDGQNDDLLESIMSECQTYGDIIDCKIGPGGHALVYFQEVGSAAFARQCLYSKLTSDETDTDDIEDDITHTNDDAVIINDAKFKVTFHF